MLVQHPWKDWTILPDHLVVRRIMLWNGQSSEPSASPGAVNATPVFAMPKESSSNRDHWISCPYSTLAGSDVRYQTCVVKHDRSHVLDSDAIVIPGESVNENDLPSQRRESQRWVLWTRTAPAVDIRADGKVSRFGTEQLPSDDLLELFNWTMTERNSDVVVYYNPIHPRPRKAGHSPLLPVRRDARNIWDLVESRADTAWIAGDFESKQHEEILPIWLGTRYDTRDSRTVDVALYFIPNCGVGYCDSLAECVAYVARHFNFILVTEESACFGSIYELVYEVFKHDLVALVLPSRRTTLHLPPKSVVSPQDVGETESLSKFLRRFLDEPATYEEFFAWKREYAVTTREHDLCPLCIKLHATYDSPKCKNYPEQAVREWWNRRVNREFNGLYNIFTFYISQERTHLWDSGD
ncbi:hypothetical protein MTO96_037666 [Rhipicephalus appendiculatus]